MARMSVDDMVARDTKFDQLAELCGWSRRETVGCMFEIWALCYDRVTPNVTAADLDITAKRNASAPVKHPGGFAAALIESRLARPATKDDRFYVKLAKDKTTHQIPWADPEWRDRIYVCGASDRIGYLLSAKEYGSQGGHKSAEGKTKSGKGPSRGQSVEGSSGVEGVRNPPSPSPSPSPVPVPSPSSDSLSAAVPPTPVHTAGVLSPPLEHITPQPRKPRKPKAAPVEGYAETIADFTTRFVAAHQGSKPTWSEVTGANLKRLLVHHGEAEVRRRIAILFESPPSWLTGRDFGTLVSQFDKLVSAPQQTLRVGRVEPRKPEDYPTGEVTL